MPLPKRWNIAAPHAQAQELAARLKVSTVLAQVLLNRGFSDPADCHSFLKPSLKCLHDPATLPGVPKAAERIAKAIRDQQKIVVYGDYDVDGITAVSILWHAIRTLGGIVEYYIPHRIDEGYGLNPDAVAEICDAGAQLIITVDCGVTAIEPAKIAKGRNVDLIITDHHEWKESTDGQPIFPDVYAIVHPRIPAACGFAEEKSHDLDPAKPQAAAYENPSLCGAGVAFKLAWAIGQAVNGTAKVSDTFKAFLLEATAFAGLGTIADVVPLVGENRVLAAFGLGGLKASKLLGIQALIECASLTGQTLDSFDVGFKLGPRLNAIGRLGHAKLAVEMLTDASAERAKEIATFLETQNRERQTVEKKILAEAIEQAGELGYDKGDSRGIVLASESWHAGVIGIVASRIVERFYRPTVMIALANGHGHGSARSIAGFHLAKALDACTAHLETHGGHEMAAGLRLQTSKLPNFRKAFHDYAHQTLTPEQLIPELTIDSETELRQVNAGLVIDLKRLGPFGQGNRRPILACQNVELISPPRRVGKTGEHLQLMIRQNDATMKCIAFKTGELFEKLTPGTKLNLAVEPTLNEWNGNTTVELEVKDIQFA